MAKVLVVGSLNMDQIITVNNLPQVGQTLFGKQISYACGGKGANQAVALAKMGLTTTLLGKVGNDQHGITLLENLQTAQVDVRHVLQSSLPTGLASIYVAANGDNTIVLIQGANYDFTEKEIAQHEQLIASVDCVVCQLEIPLSVVLAVFKLAKKHGVLTLLNPAPAVVWNPGFNGYVDFCIPNETEFQTLFGLTTPVSQLTVSEITHIQQTVGHSQLIITHGADGVYWLNNGKLTHFAAQKVVAVDSTAAGDSFVGGFCYQYLQTKQIKLAIAFGIQVASITVTRPGAQSAIPTLAEVQKAYPK